MSEKKCVSCNKSITNDKSAVELVCPSCGGETLMRCGNCRKTAVRYNCKKCGYEGP